MTRHMGGEIAAAQTKFSFWGSMADLGRLVMRSGAPFLRLRIAAALALVFVGKFAGVISPVLFGDAINHLAPKTGTPSLSLFVIAALGSSALSLAAAWTPYLRDAIFYRVS